MVLQTRTGKTAGIRKDDVRIVVGSLVCLLLNSLSVYLLMMSV